MRGIAQNTRVSSRKRRIIYTVVLLAAAGLLAWWGSENQSRRYTAIRERIMLLCESLAGGETPTWQYDMVAPPVAEPVIGRLQALVAGLDTDRADTLRIEVAPISEGQFDRGPATHQATISVHGRPELVLLVESGADPESVYITGWREPDMPK